MSPFDRFEPHDVLDLIAEHPLAWVVPREGPGTEASLLPLLAETDAEGRLQTLLGHVARRNPLFARLSGDPRVLVLVDGPHGYISGSWVQDRRWVPTWNFAQLRISGELRFEPEGGHAALATLVDAMEAGREGAWRVEEAGDRYPAMERAIAAFRIVIERVEGRFKLGQDERPEVLADIIERLPSSDLARWMRRFNQGRC